MSESSRELTLFVLEGNPKLPRGQDMSERTEAILKIVETSAILYAFNNCAPKELHPFSVKHIFEACIAIDGELK